MAGGPGREARQATRDPSTGTANVLVPRVAGRPGDGGGTLCLGRNLRKVKPTLCG